MVRTRKSRRVPSPGPAAPAQARAARSTTGSSDIYSHSDREREELRTKMHTRGRAPDDATASLLDVGQKKALEKAGWDRETAMRRLAMEDGPTSSSANALSNSDDRMDMSVEVGRKEHATPAQNRRETTGLELDDDLFDALEDSLDDEELAAPASGQRSNDTSSLNTSMFKRRGRAPSISLHGNDAPIRPSSRGVGTPAISSSFNIGVFRRRQREPSILGTAQKERAQRAAEISSPSASEGEGEGEDFSPEAESTPLTRRKTQPPVPNEEDQSEAQPHPEPESEPEPEVMSSAKSRKRKSMESHDPVDRPDKIPRPDETNADDDVDLAPAEDSDDNDDDDDESELSSLPSLPSPGLPPTLRAARLSTPIDDEAIMAPPESSDSEEEEQANAWPDIRNLGKRRRQQPPATPPRDGNLSDTSSPPSLTHSPNFTATRQRQQSKKQSKKKGSPKMSTADLTGLLPRRRQRRDEAQPESSDSELDASGLANDDDELSHLNTRTARRRGRTTPLNRGAQSKVQASPKTRPRRTYNPRYADKENDAGGEEEGESYLAPAPDDTFDAPGSEEPTNVPELRDAIKKFKEVDKWELEYEEVTQSSSPSNAR